MDIKNQPPAGPARSNPLRGRETSESASGAASSEGASSSASSQKASDRVEISASAREAQSASGDVDPADAALVERGRAALEGSSLSGERLAELKQRASEGYYTTPEAAEQIAEGLAEEAGGA